MRRMFLKAPWPKAKKQNSFCAHSMPPLIRTHSSYCDEEAAVTFMLWIFILQANRGNEIGPDTLPQHFYLWLPHYAHSPLSCLALVRIPTPAINCHPGVSHVYAAPRIDDLLNWESRLPELFGGC